MVGNSARYPLKSRPTELSCINYTIMENLVQVAPCILEILSIKYLKLVFINIYNCSHPSLGDIVTLCISALLTTGWFIGQNFARWPYCLQEKHGPKTGTHASLAGPWDSRRGGTATGSSLSLELGLAPLLFEIPVAPLNFLSSESTANG